VRSNAVANAQGNFGMPLDYCTVCAANGQGGAIGGATAALGSQAIRFTKGVGKGRWALILWEAIGM
jgi:hypothetical protein